MNKNDLKPAVVFAEFAKINEIPRPSKREEKMIEYLKNWGESHGLETKVDETGNVIIRKPATKGMENCKTVILQSHMDMVCDKLVDVEFDFDKDAIKTYVDGEWLTAEGTTLGADDGIGCAIELAILGSDDIEHGPIECVFTRDEETGLSGAEGMKAGFMTGDYLINLDSEDEGEIFVSCAGGRNTTGKVHLQAHGRSCRQLLPEGLAEGTYRRTLWRRHQQKARQRYQTPRPLPLPGDETLRRRSAGTVPLRQAPQRHTPRRRVRHRRSQRREGERACRLERVRRRRRGRVPRDRSADGLRDGEHRCRAGHREHRGQEIHLGLAGCRQRHLCHLSGRGPRRHGGDIEQHRQHAHLRDGHRHSEQPAFQRDVEPRQYVCHHPGRLRVGWCRGFSSDGYPAWKMKADSKLQEIVVSSYKKLFGKEPIVRGIHAGLECGLFSERYPNLDMVSFGPTLRFVHTPDERLHIPTVQMVWDHLLDVLRNIPEQ